MRKIGYFLIFSCLLFSFVRSSAQQQEPDWSKVQVEVKKLTANVYMLRFSNGTAAKSAETWARW